jgi:conjugal transfer/type IV secretion protein DotA/TraY
MFGIAPPSTDYFMNTLASILGPIVTKVTGIGGQDGLANTATALTVLLGYFNVVALFVAAFWLLYIAFVGMLKTAHEGEWLGQKWSAMWIPLRIGLAAAFVLPVVSSGTGTGSNYSAIEAAVVWVEGNAVGMADKAWTLSAKYIVSNPIGGVTLNPSHVRSIADDILLSETCMAAGNKSIQTDHSLFSPTWGSTPVITFQSAQQTTIGERMASIGNAALNVGNTVWDGKTYHPTNVKYWADQWNAQTSAMGVHFSLPFVEACGGINYPYASTGSNTVSGVDNAVWSVSSAQMGTLITGIQPLVNEIVAGQEPSIAAYKQLITTYDNNTVEGSLAGIAAAEKPAEQKFLTGVNAQGFATAGSWWWQLMHLNQTAQQAMNGIGTTEIMSTKTLADPVLGNYFKRRIKSAATFIADYKNANSQGPNGSPEGGMPSRDGISGAITQVVQDSLGNGGLWAADEPRNKNPILGIEHIGTIFETIGGGMIGDKLIGGPVTKLLTKITGYAAAAQVGADPIADGAYAASKLASSVATGTAGQLMMILGLMFFGLGLVMTVWIPMLPYIIWTFAMFGLLIFFVEAVFAAPFWAIAHMNPDGHEVVGSGARGWMMILQVLLKPVLMVGGLIAGTSLLYAGAWMLQHTIGGAILDTFDNSAGGFVGIFDALAQTILYCVMLIIFIDMSFGLIHKLPDLVFGWIGGGSTDRGEGEMQNKEGGHRGKAQGHAQTGADTISKM